MSELITCTHKQQLVHCEWTWSQQINLCSSMRLLWFGTKNCMVFHSTECLEYLYLSSGDWYLAVLFEE